jgi:hypothetical protein
LKGFKLIIHIISRQYIVDNNLMVFQKRVILAVIIFFSNLEPGAGICDSPHKSVIILMSRANSCRFNYVGPSFAILLP